MRLHELDERYLPVAAARLRRAVDVVAARRDRLVAHRDRLVTAYRRRPLQARVRQAPAVSATVVALLLVGAVGTVVWQGGGSSSRPVGVAEPPLGTDRGTVLGPKVGSTTQDYERATMAGLIAAVQATPGQKRVALVSIGDYRSPEEADALLTGFTITRVFVRAHSAGKLASPLPIDLHGPLLPQLRKAFSDTARSREQASRSFQGYLSSLTGSSPQTQALRRLYGAFASSSRLEAKAYASDCRCVYAAVVIATPAQLLSLRARPGIRAVEVAAAGLTVLQVQTQPLLPEVVGVVPKPGAGVLS